MYWIIKIFGTRYHDNANSYEKKNQQNDIVTKQFQKRKKVSYYSVCTRYHDKR